MTQERQPGLLQRVHDAICPFHRIKALNRLEPYCPVGMLARRTGAKEG